VRACRAPRVQFSALLESPFVSASNGTAPLCQLGRTHFSLGLLVLSSIQAFEGVLFNCLLSVLLIRGVEYVGLFFLFFSVGKSRTMLVAVFRSRFHCFQLESTHVVPRWCIRSTLRLPCLFSLHTASVRSSQRLRLALCRRSHMIATATPSRSCAAPRRSAALWCVTACLFVRCRRLTGTEGSHRYMPSCGAWCRILRSRACSQ